MPARYDILPAHNLLLVVGFAQCTGADYAAVNEAAAADPRRRPGMDAILDMHAITSFAISLDELQAIVAMDRRLHAAGVYGERFRTALVIRSEEEETIGRLYNLLVQADGMGVMTFYRLPAALEWLGLADTAPAITERRAALIDGAM